MVRAARHDPPVYFGVPGSLVTLPWPRSGLAAPYQRQTFDFITGTGNHRVSTLIGGSRLYTINWDALHQSTFDRVNQYWLGTMGPGPFAFIDPSRPNLLTPNQAAACSVWNDTTGIIVVSNLDGYVSANSNATHIHRVGGTRSIRWHHTNSPAWTPFPQLRFISEHANWPGFPVMAGLPYTFSVWVKPVDDPNTVQAAVKLFWMDGAGTDLSNSTSGDITITAGVWTRLSVTGTAPAFSTGSFFLQPRIMGVSSTFTAGVSLYLDEPLLEQDTVVNDWAPGSGVPPIGMLDWNEDVPWVDARFRLSPQLIIREVVTS
jgi:hypothetical protein